MKPMRRKIKVFQLVLWTVLGVGALFLLLKSVSLNDLIKTFQGISPIYLVLGFILYFIIYLLRTWRFSFLLRNKIKFQKLFSISCIHNFFNMLLPARLGELSYAFLLKKEGVKITKSFSHIILSRIYDLLGIMLLFFLSLAVFLADLRWKALALIATAAMLVLLTMFFKILVIIKKIISLLKSKHKLIKALQKFMDQLLYESTLFSTEERIKLIALSLLLNTLMYLFGYIIVKAMGVDLSIWAIFVGGTLAFLTTILPIQGMFNIGTMELGWTFSYVLVGMTQNQAILTGLAYHLVNIVFTTVFFALGLILKAFLSRRDKR